MTCPQEGSDDDAVVASRTDPERFAELFQRRAGEIYRYHALVQVVPWPRS